MDSEQPDSQRHQPEDPSSLTAPGAGEASAGAIDGQRFVELLGAHERPVFRYIYSLTANWNDAEEVMQRVRVRLWQQFAQYDDQKSFAGWARAIAYYVVLAYRKEKSRRVFSESVIAELRKTYDAMAEDVSDRHEALLCCLDELPADRQALIVDYYSNHGAVEKVAERIGLTTTALRQSVYRIRKKLQQCVQLRIEAIN